LSALPPEVAIFPGLVALDATNQTFATLSPTQLVEVLAQIKTVVHCLTCACTTAFFRAFVITHPQQARTPPVAHPQVAYAPF
ncbi:hypothetical protein EDD16DRAFT_1429311, partial [Pisolithus croceorrhizus]